MGRLAALGLAFVLALGVLALGWWLGASGSQLASPDPTATERSDLPSAAAAPCPPCRCSSGRGERAPEPGELAELRQRLEVAEARLAVTRMLEAGCRGEQEGVPEGWPAETPMHLGAQEFPALLSRCLDECGVDAELLGADCDEPPCLAVLRPGRRDWIWGLIRDCPCWAEHIKRVPKHHRFQPICPDGTKGEELELLSPDWPDYPGDRDNFAKRRAARARALWSRWPCEAGR